MSRSFKKRACVTISEKWASFKEKAFRRRVKQALHNIEVDFDPDADWEEANLTNKGMAEYGTKFGFPCPPNPDDDPWWKDMFKKLKRK